MNRRAYSKALKRVLAQNGRLKVGDINLPQLSPHLRQLSNLRSDLNEGAVVALPSLWVRGAYWSVQLTPERCLLVKACRTEASYKGKGAHIRVPTPGPPPLHLSKALNYAESSWPHILRNDLSFSAALFTLYDPVGLSAPVNGLNCSARFSVDLQQLPKGDATTFSELLNTHMIGKTEEPTKQEEWLGDGSVRFYHCLRCGRALLPVCCSGCKVPYLRPQQFPADGIPMPQRIKSLWHSAGIRFNPVDGRAV